MFFAHFHHCFFIFWVRNCFLAVSKHFAQPPVGGIALYLNLCELQHTSNPFENQNSSSSQTFCNLQRLFAQQCATMRLHFLSVISAIKASTLHDGCKQGIDQRIFNRKSISRKITHPQSWKLRAKLTGEKVKGWSTAEKKTNSGLQSKSRNTSSEIITT